VGLDKAGVVPPKSLFVMGNTLKMGSKPFGGGEFLPASEAGTDISFNYLVPTVCQVLHGRIGWFFRKVVVENANEAVWGEILRLEPLLGPCNGLFNASRKDTSTPSVGGSGTSEKVGREVFLGQGRVFIIYELAKSRGGEKTLALSRFDVLSDARNGVEQDIAARTLVSGCLFRLVDLIVVLAGQTRCKSGGKGTENKPASNGALAPP